MHTTSHNTIANNTTSSNDNDANDSDNLTNQIITNPIITNASPVITSTSPVIGIHHSPLSQKFGIPRQPNLVTLPTKIEMIDPYDNPVAFVGIEAFSHLWISWIFHKNKPQAHFRPQVRPPRLGGNDKIGVFATRSMYRPSCLGLSVVKFEQLEIINNKVTIHISGADMLDQTPIIDIKPYIAYSDAVTDSDSSYAQEQPLTKQVLINPHAQQQFEQYIQQGCLTHADKQYIRQLIAQDPRPAYRQKELGKLCVMRYSVVDVFFLMDNIDNQDTFIITNMVIVKPQC